MLRRLGELDRNAGGGDTLEESAVNIGALDRIDFKIKADDRVGVVFLRFEDQRADGCQPICLGAVGIGGAPV
jgi:hypothetical protein